MNCSRIVKEPLDLTVIHHHVRVQLIRSSFRRSFMLVIFQEIIKHTMVMAHGVKSLLLD